MSNDENKQENQMSNGENKQTASESETKQHVDTKVPAKENDLEDVLTDLRLLRPYHLRLLALISFVIILNSGFSLHYVFSAEHIKYRCKYPNCEYTELLELEQNSTLDYKCKKYDVFNDSETCTEDNFNMSSSTRCSEWDYEEPDSFVGEFNLGCQDWKRTLVGTMHSAGFMIGLLLIGPLSDKFGRKKIIIFGTIFSGVIGISKSMVTSYSAFIVLETIEPILGDIYSTAYTMVAEIMTAKNRPVIVLLFASSDSAGAIFIALLAYLTPNWRTMLISLYAPAFIVILHIFILDESPRWLLTKGRKVEAEKILEKAAKFNKTEIDNAKFVNLKSEEVANLNLLQALRVTLVSRKLLIRLLMCFCLWFTALFNTYTMIINSVSLEGSKYLNFALVSLSNLVGGITLLFVLKKFKRKGPLIISLAITGVLCVGQSFVPKGLKWLSLILYMGSEINTAITIKLVYLYTTELFPTYTRNTMLALCSAVGRIGAILAPLTPLLLVYWSSLPSFIVGTLALLTAIIVTMMPDTSEAVLPDNVLEAEILGHNDKKEQIQM